MAPSRHTIGAGRQLITVSRDRKPEIKFLYYRSYLAHGSTISVSSEEIASLSSEHLQIDVIEEDSRPLADWPTIVDIVISFVGFAGASIVAGFFGQIGADIYTKLKEKIMQVAPNRTDDRGRPMRRGLHLVFQTDMNGKVINVRIALRVDQLDSLGSGSFTFKAMIESVKSFAKHNDVVDVIIAYSENEPYWMIVQFRDSKGEYKRP